MGLFFLSGVQAFDFSGQRIPNPRAGVQSPPACMGLRMGWTEGRLSRGPFYFFALLFTEHLAWRFSGEEEKEYIPSLRFFLSLYPFHFRFR